MTKIKTYQNDECIITTKNGFYPRFFLKNRMETPHLLLANFYMEEKSKFIFIFGKF